MGGRTFPGELEHLVLAAIMQEEGRGYGASLLDLIELRTGRSVPAGSVYVVIDRLEDKGWIVSTLDEPDPVRGGRPKRFLRITPVGLRALSEHREGLLRMWDGLEAKLEGGA